MAPPRISLCVIARDESAFIGRCLAHASHAVDEVVVLDTGSTDDTVDICVRHGARVVRDTWRDDFADARNRALAASSGAWILVLDADEQLADGSAEALRAFTARADVDGGLIALHNADTADATHAEVLGGTHRRGSPVLLPRLFRRTDDLRWEGVIHETPQHWALARASRIAAVPGAAIVHYGAVPSLVAQRDKARRNARLLHARAAADPMDPSPLGYLAYELLHAGETAAADEALAEAWRRTEARRAAGLPRLGHLRLCVVAAHRAETRRDDAELARVLDAAEHAGLRHPNLLFHRGEWHMRRGAWEPAVAAYRASVSMAGLPFEVEADPAASGWLALYRTGLALWRLERRAEAEEALDASARMAPERPEPVVMLAELLLDAGRVEDALARVTPWVSDARPDPVALAAELALRAGARTEALAFARTAVARIRAGAVWMEGHRAARFAAALKGA